MWKSFPIPDYILQGVLIPDRIYKEIDSANQKFIRGSTVKRKIHLMSWDKVTVLRNIGSLGLWWCTKLLVSQLSTCTVTKGTWRTKGEKPIENTGEVLAKDPLKVKSKAEWSPVILKVWEQGNSTYLGEEGSLELI